jgi:hypothetical protein
MPPDPPPVAAPRLVERSSAVKAVVDIATACREAIRGSSAGATAAGEGANTHSGGGSCKLERKAVEKNQRLHMKGLCLIPPAARHTSLFSEAAASASNTNKVICNFVCFLIMSFSF